MKSTFPIMAFVVCAWITSPATAAILATGYTPGTGSQLLATNGGAGNTLFVDSAATGGEQDLSFAAPSPAASVLLSGAGLWDVGDTVSITGVAFVLRNTTATGTITIDIRQGAGGIGASGAGGLTSLGTTTASYTATTPTTTSVRYANFDTPITFVADANSTSIGINIANTGALGLKAWNGTAVGRLQRYNYSNGNLVSPNSFLNFSVAGTVAAIPEPSTMLLGALNLIAMTIYRGRWI
jgi:hypothetical protein